jgi:pimeloyl-ACP methyl ester carboxylesterase
LTPAFVAGVDMALRLFGSQCAVAAGLVVLTVTSGCTAQRLFHVTAREEFTTGIIRAASLELAYVEWRGRGTPIVLLHGLGGNALWWSGLVAALSGRHVIAVDLPGHGASPPVTDWAPHTLASEIVAALRSQWTENVIWGGHSWGGKLAMIAAAMEPSRSAGVVLFDPVPISAAPMANPEAVADFLFGGELRSWRTFDEAIEGVRLLPAYQSWNRLLEQAFRRGVLLDEDGMVKSILTRERAVEVVKATYAADAAAAVEGVDAPLLLVMAEDSRQFQVSNITLLARASKVWVSGNHWLPVNSTVAVATALSDWLSSQGL